MKGIRQVLCDKGHDTLMALDQVGGNEVPVIVTIEIDLAQDQVRTVVGNDAQTLEPSSSYSETPLFGNPTKYD